MNPVQDSYPDMRAARLAAMRRSHSVGGIQDLLYFA